MSSAHVVARAAARGALMLFFLAGVCAAAAQESDATAYYEQGVRENRAGLLVAASASFTEALSRRPDYVEAYIQRALSFEGMGQIEASVRDFSAAIEHGSTNLLPYRKMFLWCRNQGIYDRGVKLADVLIRNVPSNAAAGYWEKGGFLELLKKPARALAAYRSALELLPIGPNQSSEEQQFRKTLQRKVQELEEAVE